MAKIILDRSKCIGAYSCVAIEPDMWKPAGDGKVDLDGSTETKDQVFERDISEGELDIARQAAAVCPVAAIRVEE